MTATAASHGDTRQQRPKPDASKAPRVHEHMVRSASVTGKVQNHSHDPEEYA
jgi:hypothetical protein